MAKKMIFKYTIVLSVVMGRYDIAGKGSCNAELREAGSMYQLILTVRGDKVRINYLTLFTVSTRKVRRQAGGQCDQSVSLFELHLRVDTVDTGHERQGNPTPTITRSQ